VLRISLAMMAETPWTRLLAPLLAAIPLFTLANFLAERSFARKWGRLILAEYASGFTAGAAESEESVA
jgi:hypothetical protein